MTLSKFYFLFFFARLSLFFPSHCGGLCQHYEFVPVIRQEMQKMNLYWIIASKLQLLLERGGGGTANTPHQPPRLSVPGQQPCAHFLSSSLSSVLIKIFTDTGQLWLGDILNICSMLGEKLLYTLMEMEKKKCKNFIFIFLMFCLRLQPCLGTARMHFHNQSRHHHKWRLD